MNWNNITLAKFQQIDEVNKRDLGDVDKLLFSMCVLYDMTEYELDNADPRKVIKMMGEVEKVFLKQFTPAPSNKIGKYFIKYDVSTITLGQYIELNYFLNDPLKNAHYVLATMANKWLRKHSASDHRMKAEYFSSQPVSKVVGCMEQIKNNYAAFNQEYKSLFGIDKVVSGDAEEDEFNKRYGWIYSATQVAQHEGITLDEAFGIPIRQAFNDLAFLKAKGKYEALQFKKMKTPA